MSFLSQFLHALLYPLSISFGIIHRVFQWLTSWSTTSPRRRNLTSDPASVADRWVRELEEETGAIRESRIGDVLGVSTGAEAQAGPGPSTLSRRNESTKAFRKHIPEFYLGSYEAALREAQREYKPLCVVLVSEEHDDVPEFKKTTLVDNEFNDILKRNDFLVWGGDVRDYEASQASQKLGATTYPFVAFISLQRQRGQRGSNTSPVLTVLSRHQGPSYPNDADLPVSELGPTSARALTEHLNGTLLPRVQTYLDGLRAAHEDRLNQRRLREEQDAAYALAAQRDQERIVAKMAEEKRQREELEMQELRRLQEDLERKRRAEEKAEREANRLHWYRYARRCLLAPEQKATNPKETVRIGVRLPDGRRAIRQFAPSDNLTSLYIFVATNLVPKDLPTSEDPTSPPAGFAPGEAGVTEDNWSFKLATAYPRQEIRWSAGTPLSAVQALQGGAQLVVESIPGHALIPGTQDSHGDSDYDTEEE